MAENIVLTNKYKIMKREIKVRAWNGEQMMYRGIHDRNWYTESKGGKVIRGAHPTDSSMSMLEFTGLLDKNGKEIYEGDIVKYTTLNTALKEEESIAYIDWCTWSFALFKKYKGERNYFTILDKICSSKIKVIGNIYENPELL